MRRGVVSALALAASATLWGARESGAQDVGARINAVRTGTVRLTYAAALGVCGNGSNWTRARGGRITEMYGTFNGSMNARDVENTCDRGPVRVVVLREDGDTKAVRVYVGGTWKADTGITDLGAVSVQAATSWLLQQAERGPEKVARQALQAAMLADSTKPGAILLRIARDDSRSQDVRGSAVSWLGEVVGERVSASLDSIAYETGDREVRRSAIFALSRRPAEEAIPALVKMAESLPDREMRRTAVMALAQTKDPKALAWLEGRLAGK
jgi:hypothetical protein